jgi:LPS sulfotransferase NodH
MKKLLFICTTPRTGSSMLRGDIKATGAMGDPREWFNMTSGRRYDIQAAEWGVARGDLGAYAAALREHTATANGVVGVKIFEYHLQQLGAEGMIGRSGGRLRELAERLGEPDPVVVTLTRHNKLRQAISFYKARQTGKWGTRGKATGKAKFDRKGIEKELVELVNRENRWDRELEASGFVPHLRLIYEVLVGEREESLLRIARALELPDPESVVAGRRPEVQRLERQADDQTEEWVNRFIGWDTGDGRGVA